MDSLKMKSIPGAAHFARLIALTLFLCLFLGAQLALCEENSDSGPGTESEGRLTGAAKAGPKQDVTFWLLDDNGNWKIPLPNWTVDDVSAFLDRREEEKSSSPYTILSFSAAGEITGEIAEISIEYQISLNTAVSKGESIRVPLGMKEGIYRTGTDKNGAPYFSAEGAGRVSLDVDIPTGGYAALITPEQKEKGEEKKEESKSETEEELSEASESAEIPESAVSQPADTGGNLYTVHITLFFPVLKTANTDERLLHITPPPAVSSQATLSVPLPDAELSASEGAIAARPVFLNEKTSEIKITGFNRNGKTTDIRWRPAAKNEAAIPATYRVENASIELAPGGDGIEYNVRLPIRFFGGSKETPVRILRVELPEGTRPDMQNLHAVNRDNIDIPDTLCREIFADENRPRPAIEVSVPGNLEFVILRFAAFAPISEDRKWECTGFHLDGAQKETGDLTVRLPADENILPDLVAGPGIRELENSSETADETDTEKAIRYRFYKEPFSLKSDPIPRLTRTIAVPEFQILAGRNGLKMKARITYSIYGAPLRSLRVAPADWFVSRVDSDGYIDTANICDDPETGEKIFPLKNPAEGEFTVEWEAVRDLRKERDRIEFGLPEIAADWTAPASVLIIPDDDIELIPLQGRLTSLELKNQTALRSGIEIPKRQQQPLLYQVHGSGAEEKAPPLFSARFIEHTGMITAESNTDVHLGTGPTQIEQTLRCRVKYVPAAQFGFVIPAALADLPNPEILLNGKPISPDSIADFSETGPGAGQTGSAAELGKRKVIRFSENGIIGDFRLTFRYTLENQKILPERSNLIEIPIVLPDGVSLTANRVEITVPPEIDVRLPDPENPNKPIWKTSGTGERDRSRTHSFVTHELKEEITLIAEIREDEREGGRNVIERLWAQTWINADSRFERFFCRVAGNRPYLEMTLPEGVHSSQLEIRIDNSPVTSLDFNDSDRKLRIPLPESAKTSASLIDISYLITGRAGGKSDLTFPDFSDKETVVRRCCRQLILPGSLHLRRMPKGWMPEYDDLTWNGFFLSRRASMTTQELADWVGTSQFDPVPKNVNEYLLGSFAPPVSVPLLLISRASLVFIGSCIILILGVIYIYLPKIRVIEGIAIPILVSLAALILRPSVVLVYLQTTVLGAVLLLLVFLLKRFIGIPAAPVPLTIPPRGPEPVQVTEQLSEPKSTAAQKPAAPPQEELPSTETHQEPSQNKERTEVL